MLELNDLSKRFGRRVALDGVSLSVGEEEILALLGPTGAGKTTTLRLIAGLDAPDTGDIAIAGGSNSLDWVICGGESGPSARPMHPDWARSLRDQCQDAGVPFHFKQWGEWSPVTIDTDDDGDLGAAYAMPGCSDPAQHHGDHRCLFWQQDQLVEWPYIVTTPAIGARRVGKARAGRLLDGREWSGGPAND